MLSNSRGVAWIFHESSTKSCSYGSNVRDESDDNEDDDENRSRANSLAEFLIAFQQS